MVKICLVQRTSDSPLPGGATGSGNSGIVRCLYCEPSIGGSLNCAGPYLDCYCVPEGSYTPGSIDLVYTLLSGTNSSGTT